jgi:hypothetical protein
MNEPFRKCAGMRIMNYSNRQIRDDTQANDYGGVVVEPYRGKLTAPIRTRPVRPRPVYLWQIRDFEEDVPRHSFGGGLVRVFRYALGRFAKLWILLPLFVLTLFFEVSHGRIPPRQFMPYSCGTQICEPLYELRHPLYSAYNFNTLAGPKLLLVFIAALLSGGVLTSAIYRAWQRSQGKELYNKLWFGCGVAMLWVALGVCAYVAVQWLTQI